MCYSTKRADKFIIPQDNIVIPITAVCFTQFCAILPHQCILYIYIIIPKWNFRKFIYLLNYRSVRNMHIFCILKTNKYAAGEYSCLQFICLAKQYFCVKIAENINSNFKTFYNRNSLNLYERR